MSNTISTETSYMPEFFFQYVLFCAKILTIVIGIFCILAIISTLASSKKKSGSTLSVRKINDKFSQYKRALEKATLPKQQLRNLHKNRKKILKKNTLSSSKISPKIYVIRFYGDISASEVTNLRECVTAILSFYKKGDEVLVLVNSTGGLVHHYGLAASQLLRLKAHDIKLTVAVDLCAASGGYMMACVANHIIAAPFAIIGSIGVLAQIPNFNKLLNRLNIDIEHHTAGEHKSTLTMLGKNTSTARKKFCKELEDTHTLFKDFVSMHRPVVAIDNIATGEYWYGTKALDLHLIDEIKTSDDYLLDKNSEADLYELSYEIQKSLAEKVGSMISSTATSILYKLWSHTTQPLH